MTTLTDQPIRSRFDLAALALARDDVRARRGTVITSIKTTFPGMETPFRARWISYLVLFITGIILIGCAGPQQAAPRSNLDDAYTGTALIGLHAEEMVDLLARARPHADPTGQEFIDAGSRVAVAIKATSISVGAQLIQARADAIQLQDENRKLKAWAKDVDTWWFGPRAHRWRNIIVGVFVGWWILHFVLIAIPATHAVGSLLSPSRLIIWVCKLIVARFRPAS